MKSIKNNARKHHIAAIRGQDGEVVSSKKEIANVFATFYEQLFHAAGPDVAWNVEPVCESDWAAFSRFTGTEVGQQIRKMTNSKSADQAGVIAELLKACDEKVLELIAALFDDVMDPQTQIPQSWCMTKLKVLLKKGDALDPANYRPIASLPILYKLFSRMLFSRLRATLDRSQSVDQAGFRKDFSCDDDLFVIRELAEKAEEFNLPPMGGGDRFRQSV